MKAHIADIEAALGSKAFRPRRYGDGSISVTFNLNKLGDDVAGVADWVSRIEHKTVKPEQMSVAIEQMEAAICVHLLGKGIQATVSIDPENGATVVRLPRWSADTPSHAGDVFKVFGTCPRHETTEWEHFSVIVSQAAGAVPDIADLLRMAERNNTPANDVAAQVTAEVAKTRTPGSF